MNPISALSTRITTWLDETPAAAPKTTTPPRTPEPVTDSPPPIERNFDERVRIFVKFSTARAEAEPAAAVVVGKPFTDSVHEVPLTRTDPSTRQLMQVLAKAWPGLSEDGLRTIAAQHLVETNGGSASWNWNLGNMKASASQPHIYLHGTWEVVSPEATPSLVANSNNLAHVATDDEVKAHNWSCPPGQKVVVFEPPHPASRFRSFGSLSEGVAAWVGKYQALATTDPRFLSALSAGDTVGVAHQLKLAKYYTGGEGDYAAGLQRWRPKVDAAEGWSP